MNSLNLNFDYLHHWISLLELQQAAISFTAEEAEAFRASIKEPEYVCVTPEMAAAGLDRLEDLTAEMFIDRRYVVESIYMAMEYERRARS